MHVDDNIIDLAVKVGRIDEPLLVVPIGPGAPAYILVGRQDA
jgi:hypothetical protein